MGLPYVVAKKSNFSKLILPLRFINNTFGLCHKDSKTLRNFPVQRLQAEKIEFKIM